MHGSAHSNVDEKKSHFSIVQNLHIVCALNVASTRRDNVTAKGFNISSIICSYTKPFWHSLKNSRA